MGHYIAGGLLKYEPTVEALVAAGMHMASFDKRHPWTYKAVKHKVLRSVRDGMKQPMDGDEAYRAMRAVHRRVLDDPQFDAEVIAVLTGGGDDQR